MELVGGVLIIIGLFTRPVHSSQRLNAAAAYFMATPPELLPGDQPGRGWRCCTASCSFISCSPAPARGRSTPRATRPEPSSGSRRVSARRDILHQLQAGDARQIQQEARRDFRFRGDQLVQRPLAQRDDLGLAYRHHVGGAIDAEQEGDLAEHAPRGIRATNLPSRITSTAPSSTTNTVRSAKSCPMMRSPDAQVMTGLISIRRAISSGSSPGRWRPRLRPMCPGSPSSPASPPDC